MMNGTGLRNTNCIRRASQVTQIDLIECGGGAVIDAKRACRADTGTITTRYDTG
jgi:hypothetical protein